MLNKFSVVTAVFENGDYAVNLVTIATHEIFRFMRLIG